MVPFDDEKYIAELPARDGQVCTRENLLHEFCVYGLSDHNVKLSDFEVCLHAVAKSRFSIVRHWAAIYFLWAKRSDTVYYLAVHFGETGIELRVRERRGECACR